MAWEMTMCVGPDADLIEKTFENFEDGKEWLQQNHPEMLQQRWNSLEGENWRQYGMNYYWAAFTRCKEAP